MYGVSCGVGADQVSYVGKLMMRGGNIVLSHVQVCRGARCGTLALSRLSHEGRLSI